MLYILGMTGKWIGIILLCILILLAALLLAVLFVPIRYHLSAVREENGPPQGKVRVYWLFSLVSASAAWEGGLKYGLRLCGFPVYGNLKSGKGKAGAGKKAAGKERRRSRKKKHPPKTSTPEEETEKKVTVDSPVQERRPEEASGYRQKDDPLQPGRETNGDTAEAAAPQPRGEAETVSGPEDTDRKKEKEKRKKPGFRVRLSEFWQKILSFLRMLGRLIANLLALPERLRKKAEDLKEKADRYVTFLLSEEFVQAGAVCKKQLLFLVRSIKPRKIRADIRFGFSDPATTGQILAFVGMIYPLLGKTVILRPDFEEALCCGKITVKGRIFLFDLLRIAWILYFNKNIKRLIRMWKKEEALHDGQ